MDFLASYGSFTAHGERTSGGEAKKKRDQNLPSHRSSSGQGKIQRELAAKNRKRATSRMDVLVVGWLVERLVDRASRIMEIKAGLSNLFFRLDRQCSRPSRNGTLARQNTMKTCAAKTLDGLGEKRFTTTISTWIRRLIDRSCCRQRVESSEKQGPNRSCPSLDLGFSDIHKTSVEKVRTLQKYWHR